MALYGVALLMRARTLDLRSQKLAVVGAVFSISLLAAIWVREVFVVESERIKALLDYGG
jgi:hypothetical protein